jgi:hypothetical protein
MIRKRKPGAGGNAPGQRRTRCAVRRSYASTKLVEAQTSTRRPNRKGAQMKHFQLTSRQVRKLAIAVGAQFKRDPIKTANWMVSRHAMDSGRRPDEDAAAINSYFRSREEALAAAEEWADLYPEWTIKLSAVELTWLGRSFKIKGPLTNLGPLTQREREFINLVLIAMRGPDAAGMSK